MKASLSDVVEAVAIDDEALEVRRAIQAGYKTQLVDLLRQVAARRGGEEARALEDEAIRVLAPLQES